MGERNIAIRVDEELFKQVKKKITEKDISMKDYITLLIKQDLLVDLSSKYNPVIVDDISQDTIEEAKKLIDFVDNLVNGNYIKK